MSGDTTDIKLFLEHSPPRFWAVRVIVPQCDEQGQVTDDTRDAIHTHAPSRKAHNQFQQALEKLTGRSHASVRDMEHGKVRAVWHLDKESAELLENADTGLPVVRLTAKNVTARWEKYKKMHDRLQKELGEVIDGATFDRVLDGPDKELAIAAQTFYTLSADDIRFQGSSGNSLTFELEQIRVNPPEMERLILASIQEAVRRCFGHELWDEVEAAYRTVHGQQQDGFFR